MRIDPTPGGVVGSDDDQQLLDPAGLDDHLGSIVQDPRVAEERLVELTGLDVMATELHHVVPSADGSDPQAEQRRVVAIAPGGHDVDPIVGPEAEDG